MKFEWDPKKQTINTSKHDVTFQEAAGYLEIRWLYSKIRITQ